MENIEIITLQRERDFSRRISATFEFIKQNFGSLLKTLLVIAGPSVVITAAIITSMVGDMFNIISGVSQNPEAFSNYFLSVSFWLQLVLMLALFYVTACMTVSAVNNYIILYDEQKTNRVSVSDVWDRVRASFWMYAGTMLMFFLMMIGIYLVLVFVSVIFSLITPFLTGLLFLACYCAFVWALIAVSLTFFIRSYEKKGLMAAISRSINLIKGEWWSSFGFYFVIYLISSTLASLAIIPFYILFFFGMMHTIENPSNEPPAWFQWSMLAMFLVYYVVSILVNVLPNVAAAFQYFNLAEIKESRGLISDFESIGQQLPNNTEEEQY
ncbi:MAG TPA: hypothetical protein VKZ68_07070 [Ohtaekwangia sp.]|nr:hypothetical protein [Ohtaekwangia sp.]